MAYKWKLTAKKFLWIAGEVIVAGVIVYLTDNNLYLAIIPALEALRQNTSSETITLTVDDNGGI